MAAREGVPADARLERLFQYTKWHIGIYLSFGGGLVGLLASRDGNAFLCQVIAYPVLMGVALLAMAVAGLAGGILVSATTRWHTFDEVWFQRHPLLGRCGLTGRAWAALEHLAFWISLTLIAAAVLSPDRTKRECADSSPPAKTFVCQLSKNGGEYQ